MTADQTLKRLAHSFDHVGGFRILAKIREGIGCADRPPIGRIALILALAGTAGCHPLGRRIGDMGSSGIKVEQIDPPSPDIRDPRSPAQGPSSRTAGRDSMKPRTGQDPARRIADRSEARAEEEIPPAILDTTTPDPDLDASIASLPPALQQILAKQFVASQRFQVNGDFSKSEPTQSTEPTPPPKEEPFAAVKLGKPETNPTKVSKELQGSSVEKPIAEAKPSSPSIVKASLSDRTESAGAVQPASVESSEGESQPVSNAYEIKKPSEGSSVVTAESHSAVHANWQRTLATAIEQLQHQIEADPKGDEALKQHREATLRLLYLSNGKLDEAMEKIDGYNDYERGYWEHQMKALFEAIKPDATPVRSRRWSLVLNSQNLATDQLAAVSNLEVKSTAFCTAVDGYGVITKFPTYQFKPDQDVLLYCELENVAAQPIKDSFETQLQGSYEILDRNGTRVADQLLQMEREVCKNRRRDYFIVYRIYMPMQIAPGNYQLRLAIEDMKAHKFGQSTIDFQITK